MYYYDFIKVSLSPFWLFYIDIWSEHLENTKNEVLSCVGLSCQITQLLKKWIFLYSFISFSATWLSRWGIWVLLKGTLIGFKHRCAVMGQSLQLLDCPAASPFAVFKEEISFWHQEELFVFSHQSINWESSKSQKVLAVNRSRHNLHCIFGRISYCVHKKSKPRSSQSKFYYRFIQSIWDGEEERREVQYIRGQKGRGEDKLWRCSGERMNAGTQRGWRESRQRAEKHCRLGE